MKQRLPGGNKPHKNTLKTAVKLLFFLFLISRFLSLIQVQANFEKVVIGNFDCVCFFFNIKWKPLLKNLDVASNFVWKKNVMDLNRTVDVSGFRTKIFPFTCLCILRILSAFYVSLGPLIWLLCLWLYLTFPLVINECIYASIHL